MRIGLDATPLLGRRTGIGRYVLQLAAELSARTPGDELIATAFTLRGSGDLADAVPPGVPARSRPVPARMLRELWRRAEWPPVELLCGRIDLFHGTNFVLPPSRAAGVVTVHDLAYLRYRDTVSADSARLRELVPRSLARARMVCVPSPSVAEDLQEEYRLSPDRVQVTPLGVDPAWSAAVPLAGHRRQELGLDRPYLLFVGTLEPRKNLDFLLRAFTIAAAEDPDGPVLALAGPVGWGPDVRIPEALTGRVLRLGYLDDADLRSVVAGAEAMVFPSRYEGFGLPPLEAFAAGVPVVASDIPTTREIVGTDPDLARLVPLSDVTALAEALAQRWTGTEEPERRRRRQAVTAGYTWTATAELTRRAYERARAG
ncbi:glycosyltransferase family 4 protein [Blastococcus capsensis]|uniref:glycosyltransferase family 4 protein n=1 Tax=Blastococcus capsensis TaxID=1564163 RepID=UPI00253FDA02|nr:glycosyltransferase family 1 protein [Blastococcus capsensis]MDK3256149.1 glycosyltransferase family 1 protein [Blastococcus capsensis]